MNTTKLIVIGDPHVLAEPVEKRGVNSAENLHRAVTHINQHHPDAALCLFIGDLGDEGISAEYENFKTIIKPLTVPPALMLGNHDHRASFLNVFPDARQDSNGFIQFTIDLDDRYRLIALDSLNAPPYSDMRHVGRLCDERLAYLEGALQSAENRQIIIAMHHHPFRIGLPGMDTIRLWNGEEYLALIKRSPNVAMQLMGHNHRAISGVSHGLPFTCFQSMSPQTPLDFNAIDPSGSIAEPPSYGVLLLTDDGILVHQEAFKADAKPITSWDEANPPTGWQQLVNIMLPERGSTNAPT